jgi:acetylglutamate kinase
MTDNQTMDVVGDALKAAIDQAIAATLAQHGAMHEGYAAIVSWTDGADRHWSHIHPDDQLHDRTIALLDHDLEYQREVRRALFQDMIRGDDDE